MLKQNESETSPASKLAAIDRWRLRVEMYKLFNDAAKSYIQISCAALAVPIVFAQTIFGKEVAENGLGRAGIPWTLLLSWLLFQLTIAFGLTYQWLAARRQWDLFYGSVSVTQRISGLWLFTPMLTSFWAGSFFFVWFAWTQLSR